jgi:excisionase family DNA binding protein
MRDGIHFRNLQGQSTMDSLLHSKAESARILGVSERLLHKLISTKQLKFRRIARRVLIPHEELLRFAKQSTK